MRDKTEEQEQQLYKQLIVACCLKPEATEKVVAAERYLQLPEPIRKVFRCMRLNGHAHITTKTMIKHAGFSYSRIMEEVRKQEGG